MRATRELLRRLLLALLLAGPAASSPGSQHAAAAHRAVFRSEDAAWRPAQGPAVTVGGFPARRWTPGACGLRDPAAAGSSHLPDGSRSVSQVCVEKSLVFSSNTPYPTENIAVCDGHGLLFCVQEDDLKLNYFQQPQDIRAPDFLKFTEKYGRHSFSAPAQVQPSFSTFYRAGDPILIYFDSSSVLSTLRQPVKMGTSGLCVDGNPAGFLESKSTSCTRVFVNLSKSCLTDPALDAASYYRDFAVLKVPVNDSVVQSMKVKVTAAAPPGAPYVKDNTCHNAVSEVLYEIEFSGTRGIQSVSVWFKVSNVSEDSGSSLQQHFALHFWTRNLSHALARSGNPGYIPGAPLLTADSGAVQHMSILRSERDGSCSQLLRHKVQFGRNMRTSCRLSLSQVPEGSDCSYIQQTLYRAFQGTDRAENLAVTGSAHSGRAEEWTTILVHDCSVQGVNCSSCCMVPVTLEVQILWSEVGLLSNPQAQILGARHFYQCQPLKVVRTSTVPLTTVVTFTDITRWPEPPRSQPQTQWKLPFDVFLPFKVAVNVERSYRVIEKFASSDVKYSSGINNRQEIQRHLACL